MDQITTSLRISHIEETSDTITGRGGLAFFNRYIAEIGILYILSDTFSSIRKSQKGLAIWRLFKQLFCFFFDGTSRHLVHFDTIKRDEGYAAAIEEKPENMASSHTVKRFFRALSWPTSVLFRSILRQLFLWRLKQEQPDIIELTLDTMVMNNDEALKRQGVQPTYKKVKGYQPLQLIWNRKIIDAVFRGGKKHGNHGDTAVNMVSGIVSLIRKHYREDVTIILRIDAGFFDEVNFESFDNLNILFIASGKMYRGVKEMAHNCSPSGWESYSNGKQTWSYCEFGYRCDSWKRMWRTFYLSPWSEDNQLLLEFARPEKVVLTNIGVNPIALQYLPEKLRESWTEPDTIIASHHGRAADELPHRGLKDFGFEQLPFKRFFSNSSFYYCMLIAFFLFESFKEDVLSSVIPVASYATSVRRKVLDFAAKIVKSSRYIVLKVSRAVRNWLKLDLLWQRSNSPPQILY